MRLNAGARLPMIQIKFALQRLPQGPSILRIERWHSALIVEVKDAVGPWRAP
jgi:hypothetical protein